MSLANFALELGLGVAFTMIALAPTLKQERNPLPSMRVNIAVGQPATGSSDSNMGGAIPNIALFDVNGQRLGYYLNTADSRNLNKAGQTKVPDGAVMDGGIAQVDVNYLTQGDTRRPEYVTISSGGFDAICVMEVTVKHPVSDDHFTFLPGEVAKQCTAGWKDGNTVMWSEQATQITFEFNGEQARSRPKCLWIDTPDDRIANNLYTKWKGFGVHLPDFAVDNTTFHSWEEDPWQMCSSRARFGLYEKINEAMCPPVFTKPPSNGARLPMSEYPGCSPGLVPDASGKVYENFCEDPSIDQKTRDWLSKMWGDRCETKEDREKKFKKPPASGTGCKRDPAACVGKRSPDGTLNVRTRALQARFAGQLVKSYDVGQSARGLCGSMGSVGPNFYSDHEKSFCDMSRKRLFPLCETEDATECFDMAYNETRHSLERRGETVKHDFVEEWR